MNDHAMPLVRLVRQRMPGFVETLGAFVRRLTVTDTTLAEFNSSTMLLGMAILMLDPWPTLDAQGINIPIFRAMLEIASEHGWGFIFLALGVLQSGANLGGNIALRKIAAFAAAVLWGLLMSLGFVTYPPSFFVPVCGAMCLVQAVVYLRLSLLQEGLRRA